LAPDLFADIESSVDRLPVDTAAAARRHIELLRNSEIYSIGQLAALLEATAVQPGLQVAACDLVGRIADEYRRVAQALAEVLTRATDRQLLWEAAKALARMNLLQVTELLYPSLMSDDDERAAAVAWTLGRLGDASASEPLRRLLRSSRATPDARAHAAEALGALASRDSLPDLAAALDDPIPEVRYWAVYALGAIGDPSVLPLLERLATSDRDVVALGSIAQEAAQAAESIRRSCS
jgi:HEAT repeat protein